MGKTAQLTKITARLYEPMYKDFDRQLSAALLRRDAFLDRMIAGEIQHLREDLAGKKLSPVANRFIAGKLKGMGKKGDPELKQVSIAVRPATANALRVATTKHNLVRDAFLNRLITLLRSSDKLLDSLDLPKVVGNDWRDGSAPMPTSPLKAIEATEWDPLYYLRNACHQRHGCGLYALDFPESVIGFSCFLDDDRIPGTPEHARRIESETLEPL